MTVGEKIKHFRKVQKLTQHQLADMTGIHLVSIAKYETDKMQPQPAQIKKIAQALGLNIVSLTGTEPLNFDTIGNTMSALLLLYNAGVIDVTWAKLGNGQPDVSSAKITLNPIFSSFLAVAHNEDNITASLNDIWLKFTKPALFSEFISYCGRKKMIQEAEANGSTAENDAFLASLIAMQEAGENWLQSDNEPLAVVLRDNLELHDKEKNMIIANGKSTHR